MLHKMSTTPRVINDVTEEGGRISPYDSKLTGIPSDQSHSRSMKSIDPRPGRRSSISSHPPGSRQISRLRTEYYRRGRGVFMIYDIHPRSRGELRATDDVQ